MLLLFLCISSIPLSSARFSIRKEHIFPIRASCSNIDFCREVSSDNLCDLECSSAECGLDGGDCNSINEIDGKLMLVLHTSPIDFMFISHRFLSEMSSITGSRVEMARDSQDLLMWEWSPDTGPKQRLYPERQTTPSGIASIQVMLIIKLADCSKDCMGRVKESIRIWYQTIRDEELSPFVVGLLYDESRDEDSSHSHSLSIVIVIAIAGCMVLLLGVAFLISRMNKSRNEQGPSFDTSHSQPNVVASSRMRVLVKEVNGLDQGQASPLHSLISSLNHPIEDDVMALLKCGESINTIDREGRTVLHIAILNGRSPSFFRWLIALGADPSTVDDKDQTLLHLAVQFNNLEIVSTLLEFPTVFRMLDHCDYRNMNALKLAMSEEESIDISRLLIDCGADVNYTGAKGKDPLLCHRCPLHLAVMNNHMDQARLLLGRGADVNTVDDEGLTALHYAAIYCGMEMVELLLNENCDVLRRDNKMKTAEDLARIKGKIEIVNLLKEASEKEADASKSPYIKNLRLHKSRELLNMEVKHTVGSSQYTYVQPNGPLVSDVYSSLTDEGVYSDYQYPHLPSRYHSTQALYYL
ncbi:hypothetical protein PENTCL1PPCAC_6604 [Pristionchus entomophagus]|uniref:LNR domain-containing protein n=1 Tax=Pristionchus entomophagus TaxID=358040 RepID=A0AAV5SW05_9BILA|nr:hypothetical protein PENTCL1PPCAC_6604 [Pristionchus entomophagus]